MKLSMHEDKASTIEKHLLVGGITTHVRQNYVTLRTYCTTLVVWVSGAIVVYFHCEPF